MRLKYTVSFESDGQPVQALRGDEVVATEASGAVKALARRPTKRRHWRSLVVVLENLDAAGDPVGDDVEAVGAGVRQPTEGPSWA
jgi:hypothetical protein